MALMSFYYLYISTSTSTSLHLQGAESMNSNSTTLSATGELKPKKGRPKRRVTVHNMYPSSYPSSSSGTTSGGVGGSGNANSGSRPSGPARIVSEDMSDINQLYVLILLMLIEL